MYRIGKALKHKLSGSKRYKKARAYGSIAGWQDEGPSNERRRFLIKNRAKIGDRFKKEI